MQVQLFDVPEVFVSVGNVLFDFTYKWVHNPSVIK